MNRPSLVFAILFALVLPFTACGGGGGGASQSNSGSGITTTPNIVINNGVELPNALQGQPYSATFSASNTQGAVKWTISPYSGAVQYVDGLTIDPATGVLSGTPTFLGSAIFFATVTDAKSRTATSSFSLNSFGKLSAGAPNNFSTFQFQDIYSAQLNIQGGIPPLHYSLGSGSFPSGVKFGDSGQIQGYALQPGTYSAVVDVSDSWSTPEIVHQTVNFTVRTANLVLGSDMSGNVPVNQPVHSALYAAGGVPPYVYSIPSGYVLPPGVTLDTATGKFVGSPTATGNYFLVANVKDSAGNSSVDGIQFAVVASHGRNDSIQNATPLQNGDYSASLSPYIDPPDKAPTPADTDYYKIVSMAGTAVSISMHAASGPIDPVIEILDANGVRLATCNSVDFATTNFTSPCVNDEDGNGGHDSKLVYKVPGSAATVVNSYIHALDWSGNARPDMQYYLSVTGNIEPINVRLGSTRAVALSYTFYQLHNQVVGATTWTIDNGALPDGLTLSSAGVLSGTPTTDGEYPFRIKVVDSSVNPQTFYIFATMGVGEPVKITSTAAWPDACVGKPYSFTVTITGGVAPIFWGFSSPNFPLNGLNGVYSGTPTTVGTYKAFVTPSDAALSSDSQSITLNVVNCP